MNAIFLMAQASLADSPIKIAILDSGFGPTSFKPNLCKFGHKDVSNDEVYSYNYNVNHPVPIDRDGHGTDMVELAQKQLEESNIEKSEYCFIIVKYFSTGKVPHSINGINMIKGLKYIANIKPDILNISGGGYGSVEEEREAVLKIVNSNTQIIASAGNERRYLSSWVIGFGYQYYPAMYHEKIIVVGSKSQNGNISRFSNVGDAVDVFEVGENLVTTRLGLSGGTSQATAIYTGKYAKKLILQRKYERFNKANKGYNRGEKLRIWSKNKNI